MKTMLTANPVIGRDDGDQRKEDHVAYSVQGASLAQSQGVMSWLGSVTASVAYARFARSLTWV